MRVFSVEMLVKEEGAAVVEAALKKLKNEATAVGAQLRTTTQAVTTTGNAMKTAAQGTQVAGDKAAKAAIGFAAVGQAIGRTGTLTADMGTRIIEAGSQIASMFGPAGLIAAAVLSTGVAVALGMQKTRDEIKKTMEELDKLADVGNVSALRTQLNQLVQGRPSQNYRDGIVALSRELANLKDKYMGTVAGLGDLTRASAFQLRMNEDLTNAEKKDLIRIGELNSLLKEKNDIVARLQTLIPIATSVESEMTEERERATKAERALTEAMKAREEREKVLLRQVQRRQEAEAARLSGMQSTIGMTAFGRGDEAGALDRLGLLRAPDIVKQQVAELKTSIGAEMTKLSTDLANMPIAVDEALLDAVKVDNLHASLSEGISGALEGGILSGLEMALASGNIGEAFRAMGQAIVSSLAKAMVNVAIAAIKLGTLLEKVRAFMMLNPAIAVASAVALLALARSMGGGATGGSMTGVGGATGLSYAVGGSSAPSVPNPIIFGPTSATSAAGMTARPNMNVTIIGPNDPTAQRAMQELMNKANSRGTVG